MSAGSLPLRLSPEFPIRARIRLRALALALLAALPIAVFAGHAAFFGDWLIDDAGITFAYARNLAAGHGLVAQPGVPAVEGFSNPAWTLLLSFFFALGLFDPVLTPKLLASALVCATFWVLLRPAREAAEGRGWLVLAPALLAVSTPFVAWTTSGLENPLVALLGALLAAHAVAAAERGADAPLMAAGACAALLALTRPDAIVLSAGVPLGLAVALGAGRGSVRDGLAGLARFGIGFAPLYGGYLGFRLAYYGEWVPNTYFAKEKPALTNLLDVGKWADLLVGAHGRMGLACAALVVGIGLALGREARTRARLWPTIGLAGLAAGSYVLMPVDWMGEYRFATLFFLCFATAIAQALAAGWQAWTRRPPRAALALFACALLAESASVHAARSRAFASWSITPFAAIADFAGHGYNRLAAVLDGRARSLLAPDLGGALYYSQLRVHDLVGLCDATIARTLTTDTAAFHRYVFGELRPTFIHVHGPWSGWAALHQAPGFAAEYVAIHEVWGSDGEQEPLRGDYVRRTALGARPESTLARLRAEYRAAGMDRATF